MDTKPDTLAPPEFGKRQRATEPLAWARPERLLELRRRRPRLALALLAAVLAGIVLLVVLLGRSGSGTAGTTVIVQRGDIEDTVTALGTLQPLNYVDVGAQVSGQLKTIAVIVGQQVKTGDLLAQIDPAVQTARVAQSRAQLQNLQAQSKQRDAELALARQQFERQKRLKAEDATSQDAYDTARAQLDTAAAQQASLNAQIEQASSQLQADEVTLGYSKISAPMDGTVASITAQVGQTLNANQQAPIILRIADLQTMTVWTQVSEADVPKLTLGMPAYFNTLGTPNKRWFGKLRQILPTPTVTNNVVLYTALFDVDNPTGELMTQMSAQVFFVRASAKNALQVPVAALHAPGHKTGSGTRTGKRNSGGNRAAGKNGDVGQKRAVTLVLSGGRHEERIVTAGVTNRVTVEIRDGLKEGDRVLIPQTYPSKPPGAAQGAGNRQGGGGRQGGAGMAPLGRF